ncbi:hypothetical protein CCHL11_09296 [Colletotrichum chlorophyti]|uniref:Uncharacterized protein n=1 Tax=Colletotrichum chlorophyti TaxID=708187 RepID=A0A1Q8RSR1_9PEZI|nr:hypothetical protein CCHL11_09296 [Colletotrichum chlorophyti]
MKFSALLTLITVFGFAAAAPRVPSKAEQAAQKKALKDLAGTDVDPSLENGTRLLDNGQGQCVAVSGKAVCSDSSGATIGN